MIVKLISITYNDTSKNIVAMSYLLRLHWYFTSNLHRAYDCAENIVVFRMKRNSINLESCAKFIILVTYYKDKCNKLAECSGKINPKKTN